MSKKLTTKDYIDILTYYNIDIPSSLKVLKQKAEFIMSQKLCRCIKKIDTKYEAKAIGICTKTIFNQRGYLRGKFKCKNRPSVTLKKRNKKS